SDHVAVELRQQSQRVEHGDQRCAGVGREHRCSVALYIDFDHLVAEPLPCAECGSRAHREPLGELLRGRRPVCGEVSPEDLGEPIPRTYLAPAIQPLIGSYERPSVALAWTEAEKSCHRRAPDRAQPPGPHLTEGGEEALERPRADSTGRFVTQLLTGQTAPTQRFCTRRGKRRALRRSRWPPRHLAATWPRARSAPRGQSRPDVG